MGLFGIRQRGLIYTFAIIFNKLIPERLFRVGLMDVYQLSFEKLTNSQPAVGYQVVEVEPDRKDRQRLREATKNWLPEIDAGMGIQDHFGFALIPARDESRYLGGLWVAWEYFREPSLRFFLKFSKQQAWIYSAYIDKEFRRRGNYAAMLSATASRLAVVGRTELLVAFNPFNKASAKAHQKFADEKKGRIFCVRFLGFAILRCSGKISKVKSGGQYELRIDR